MKTMITGGTGFIGAQLALRCLARGDEVRILGQENTKAEMENRSMLESQGANVFLGSVTDQSLVAEALKDVDTVFHLAAAQHEANIPDRVFHEVNVEGTRNLLEASIDSGVGRFVYGSTIGVYGNQEGFIDESTICRPDNIYGKTKLEAEKLVLSHKDRIPVVAIRISETYGPGDRRLLKLFKAIEKRRFFKIGPGKNLHQLIYVDDLAEGMLKAAESQKALGDVILLGGPEQVSTDEMIDTIAEVLNVQLRNLRAPLFPFQAAATAMEAVLKPTGIQPPLHRRRMDFFRKSFTFSISKAEELLDFKPRYNFRAGAAATAAWYRENNLLDGNDTDHPHRLPEDMVVDPDLAAQIEPFDTFWEAPPDVEKGYAKFAKFYKRNYFKYMPSERAATTLIISCGAGYMVKAMNEEGYTRVSGIDADPEKVMVAKRHGLNCRVANAFPYLRENNEPFDLIFAEQEINHLTKSEILVFLDLCRKNLSKNGMLVVHSLNGANPITGSEALAQNFNHYNTLTEYSLKQILGYAGFRRIKTFPLNLYIFYENPINYIGVVLNYLLNKIFQISFLFYGKKNKLFTKKIGAVANK
jgi:nucleoside-diphosphate-sugar epimerase